MTALGLPASIRACLFDLDGVLTGTASGTSDDSPDLETVHGLGNRKNLIVPRRLRERGVEAFEGSVRYLRAVRDAGLCRAVVSSSANTRAVLDRP